MHSALLFPPSMPPTSPPCGIAYLKGFVESKTFDVNLLYHKTALDAVSEGKLPIEADIQGYVIEPEQLREAVQLFRGKDFFDVKEYSKSVLIFFTYFTRIDGYMREELMKYLFEGKMSDEASAVVDSVVQPVLSYDPDIVGFSQLFFAQRDFILGLAKRFKAEDIPVIVGGAGVSQGAEAFLSEIGTQLKVDLSSIFDAAFYGEGEIPLKMYLEGEDIEKIPNTIYRKGEIARNEEAGVEDVDSLPCPDFSDFPLHDYYSPEVVLSLLTSRGCYWRRCTFCVHYSSYYTYRARSAEKVVEDISELQKRHNVKHFLFADEMVHPKKIEEVSESILREGLDIRFYAEAKPTREFTDALLEKMHTAGATALLWGVESGTQRILDLIDKGTRVQEIETVLKASREAGIWNMVFMILGYPTQTKEEVEEDIAFLVRNEDYIDTLAKSLFQLEVGSRIFKEPERFRITKAERGGDPFSGVYRYECSEGVTSREAYGMYGEHPELRRLFRESEYFGALRDHMLLYADRNRNGR